MTRETATRAQVAMLVYMMTNGLLFGVGVTLVLTWPALSANAGFLDHRRRRGELRSGRACCVVDRAPDAGPLRGGGEGPKTRRCGRVPQRVRSSR